MQNRIKDTVSSNCRYSMCDHLNVDPAGEAICRAFIWNDSLRVSLPDNHCILLVVNNRDDRGTIPEPRMFNMSSGTHIRDTKLHPLTAAFPREGRLCVFLPQHTSLYKEKCTDLVFFPCSKTKRWSAELRIFSSFSNQLH